MLFNCVFLLLFSKLAAYDYTILVSTGSIMYWFLPVLSCYVCPCLFFIVSLLNFGLMMLIEAICIPK